MHAPSARHYAQIDAPNQRVGIAQAHSDVACCAGRADPSRRARDIIKADRTIRDSSGSAAHVFSTGIASAIVYDKSCTSNAGVA